MTAARTPALLLVLGAAFATAAADTPRAPILVELFTSEGCSSCPPADHLLTEIDPHAIVLSEHVDYWDHDGWKDPYSSNKFTRRQESYGHGFGVEAYTPEMVVDGTAEFNGSDAQRAQTELQKALQHKKADVKLARSPAGLDITVENAPHSASVYLVFAQNRADSQVLAGENKGRHLEHVAVVRSLQKIGSVKHGETFHKLVEIPGDDASRRIVVFLQDSSTGPISGAAVLEP